MQWYEWLLSSIGALLAAFAGFTFYNIRKSQKQIQKLGKNSVGIQSGRDTNIKL